MNYTIHQSPISQKLKDVATGLIKFAQEPAKVKEVVSQIQEYQMCRDLLGLLINAESVQLYALRAARKQPLTRRAMELSMLRMACDIKLVLNVVQVQTYRLALQHFNNDDEAVSVLNKHQHHTRTKVRAFKIARLTRCVWLQIIEASYTREDTEPDLALLSTTLTHIEKSVELYDLLFECKELLTPQ